MPRLARQILAVLGLAAAAMTLVATPALAHSELKSSNPTQGQVVAELPAQVELTFNQQIAPKFAAVALGPRGGATSSPLDVSVQGATVTATLTKDTSTKATPGRWRVSYRVTSADGHPIEGSVDFVLRPPKPDPDQAPTTSSPATEIPTNTSPSTAAENPRAPSGDSSWTSTVVLGAIALGATMGALILLNRRSDAE